MTLRSDQSPLDPLHFDTVGIDGKIPELTRMLDMEGSDPVVALVLYGFGGIGKSTLAASLIQRLNFSSTGFKYCKVMIDRKTTDPTSHIKQLQADIVRNLGGGKRSFGNPEEGRRGVQKVMENKRCLLYIDNVVDIHHVKELLPRQLLPTKLRIVITSREGHLKTVLDMKPLVYRDYPVSILTSDAAKSLLYKTILGSEVKPYNHFDEEGLIDQVAVACGGVPILLSRFGNHLSDSRDRESYTDALESLRKGNFSEYSFESEEQLGEMLLFLYHKMSNKEAQEAFLDICTDYYGWSWDIVGHIVGAKELQVLEKRMLVTRSHSDDEVIAHDILRLMGMKEASGTRFTTYEQFSEASEDESNLPNVKGISLEDLSSIDSRHLNATHRSLRVLILGDGVTVNGAPCERTFANLTYLQLGVESTFPFKDACKLKKLAGFNNSSLSGVQLPIPPQTLKYVCQDLRYTDVEEFELPLQNLCSLENLAVETYYDKPTGLPEGHNLPTSLLTLNLSGCLQVPERLSHLTALQKLTLKECNLKFLPEGFGNFVRLEHLNVAFNEELSFAGEGFGSPNLFTRLKTVNLSYCCGLRKLPIELAGLPSLQHLDLSECKNLEILPAEIGNWTSLKQLNLKNCKNLRFLPENMGGLSLLSDLNLFVCERLEKVT